jgi:hypothetical protein
MPKNRVPTATLKARGSFDRHPERKRARASEPQPTGELGDPPKRLCREEKRVWNELACDNPPGVVTNFDRQAWETLVWLEVRRRQNRISTGELSQLVSLFARFGKTPADRSRVHAQKPEAPKNDPWNRLMQPAKAPASAPVTTKVQ